MIGKTLAHYEIIGLLGEGGMGVVYRARDTKLNRDVALKVLPADVTADPERLARLQREARMLAALDHPNIVSVFSVEEARGVHFLTMALVEGRTLDRVITAPGLGVQQFFQLAIDLADAIAAAHDKGVIHRDLKPGNVMLSDDGRLTVLDFGLAKLTDDPSRASEGETTTHLVTREGVVIGTVPHMSPEQIEGKALDPRSDVFSLGVLLYEMATGQRPFQGQTSPAVISSILKDEPVSVTEVRAELPQRLGRVIGRCLEKDPVRRFPTARGVHAEIIDVCAEWDESRHHSHDAGARATDEMSAHETTVPSGVSAASAPSAITPAAAKVSAHGESRQRRRWLAGVGVVSLLVVLLRIAPWQSEPRPEVASERTVAVLPLDDFSSSGDQNWFAAGVHEALLTALQQIDELRVTSRRSAMRYQQTDKLLPQIAQELGVKWLVEGSVVRVGDRIRITAKLIEGATDQTVWSQQYERDVRDVLALQNEVVRSIAGEIHVALTPEVEQRLAKVNRIDPESYRHYILGLQHYDRVTPEDFRASVERFEQAVELDEEFAPAHAALAITYGIAVEYGWVSRAEAAPVAERAAENAIRLDPGSGDAHHALASVRFHLDRDFAAAENSYRAALARTSSAHIFFGYGWLLSQMGRHDEAVDALERAVELDPRSPLMHGDLGWWLYGARRFNQSIDEAKIAINLDPQQPEPYWLLAAVYSQQAEFDSALAAFARYEELYGDSVPWFRGYLHALAGQRDEALRALDQLEKRVESGQSSQIELAHIYLGLGDDDETLAVLEQSDEAGVSFQPYLWPEYERLFDNPRFMAVLEKFGISNRARGRGSR